MSIQERINKFHKGLRVAENPAINGSNQQSFDELFTKSEISRLEKLVPKIKEILEDPNPDLDMPHEYTIFVEDIESMKKRRIRQTDYFEAILTERIKKVLEAIENSSYSIGSEDYTRFTIAPDLFDSKELIDKSIVDISSARPYRFSHNDDKLKSIQRNVQIINGDSEDECQKKCLLTIPIKAYYYYQGNCYPDSTHYHSVLDNIDCYRYHSGEPDCSSYEMQIHTTSKAAKLFRLLETTRNMTNVKSFNQFNRIINKYFASEHPINKIVTKTDEFLNR